MSAEPWHGRPDENVGAEAHGVLPSCHERDSARRVWQQLTARRKAFAMPIVLGHGRPGLDVFQVETGAGTNHRSIR